MSNKKDHRKCDRKRLRVLSLVKRDSGVCESSTPSNNLLVCNAGLVTGHSQENLLPVFSKYGQVMSVIAEKGKSYSFVVFHLVEEAVKCMDEVNGVIGVAGEVGSVPGPLYLAYVDKVPAVSDSWSDIAPPLGLTVLEDFVSEEEEKLLVQLFDWSEKSDTLEDVLKHRQVKHFGFEFNYKTNNIDDKLPLEEKLPELCHNIALRAVKSGLIGEIPDQLTVNRQVPHIAFLFLSVPKSGSIF